jgi:hypothetical protein
MKRTFLLFTFSAALAVITLNSNSSGPANNNNGNKTGGPGASGTCGNPGCHSGATGATGAVSLKLKSDNSPANGKYAPGQVYIVTVSGTHASLPKFGFQLMALKETANTQAGTFGNFSADNHSKVVAGITLVEQHHAIAKAGTDFKTEFEWTAPAAGTGNIKFYGILNAVNGTGSTGGDAVSPGFDLTLAEATNGINDISKQQLTIYPNPVRQSLNLTIPHNDNYELKIYSLDGKLSFKQKLEVNTPTISLPIELVTGTYTLILTTATEKYTTVFIKE